jgi:hypothetical protein
MAKYNVRKTFYRRWLMTLSVTNSLNVNVHIYSAETHKSLPH